jgi:aspartate-semialdehyde dehydrogenase
VSVIALVDPETMLGEAFQEAAPGVLPGVELKILTRDPEGGGALAEADGEFALVETLSAEALGSVDLVVVAATDGSVASVLDVIPPGTQAIVLSGAEVTSFGVPVVAGVNDHKTAGAGVIRSPHAATVGLAHLVEALDELGPSRVDASVLVPVSIHNDSSGLDELFEQTRAKLNFQQDIPTDVLGRELVFNVLPLSGTAALGEELSEVLGHTVTASVQALQVPIFHGTALSAAIQLTEPADADYITDRLTDSRVIEVPDEGTDLGPIAAAGAPAILLGDVSVSEDGLCRIWAVLDNLTRGGALNALELAESILAR